MTVDEEEQGSEVASFCSVLKSRKVGCLLEPMSVSHKAYLGLFLGCVILNE